MRRFWMGGLLVLVSGMAGVCPAGAISVGSYETQSQGLALYVQAMGKTSATENVEVMEQKLVLAENEDEQLAIASLTKIMTAVVVLEDEDLSLEQKVVISDEMLADLSEWATVGLAAGDVLTVEDLLYALMLPSAGDAGQALAIAATGEVDEDGVVTGGSIEEFAKLMNAKAAELGMTGSHFSNPIGRDEDNYSTAADVAKLLTYALENETFQTIFGAESYELEPLGKTIKKTVDLEKYNLTGAKTGFTYEGRSLASTATRNEVDYLLAVIGANWQGSGHLEDTAAIYDYYEQNYGYQQVLENGEEVGAVPIRGAEESEYVLAAADFAYFAANDDDLGSLTYKLESLTEINRRVEAGSVAAILTIYDGAEEIFRQEFLVGEISYRSYWWVFVVIIAVTGLGVMVVLKKDKGVGRRMELVTRRRKVVAVIVAVGVVVLGVAVWQVYFPAVPEMVETELELRSSTSGTSDNDETTTTASASEETLAAIASGENCTLSWSELMLINPNYTVGEDWIAERSNQLVDLTTTYGINEGKSGNGRPRMDTTAAAKLAEMVADYEEAYPGHKMKTRSCFRAEGTDCGRLCYATGTSDHHTGYTCDLIDYAYGSELNTDDLSEHIEWQWLHENSYKYGFIDRFVEDWAGSLMDQPMNVNAEGSTGLYEAWHYRYVGETAATEIAMGKYNNGEYDSLEHYLKASGRISDLTVRTGCKV